MQYQKAKSAHKNVIPNGSYLRKKVLDTSSIIASVVGGTLGPGGHPVLIEREEHGLPPDITKDGVTVIRSLGFKDSASHVLMEAERDAAVRTAATAGDGTTTATILSDAFLRRVMKFCDSNKNYSPQAVVRDIQKTYAEVFEPSIRDLTLRGDLSTPEGRKRLAAVATVSANGDTELADAVLEAYDICGDDGNVTILEASGKVSSIEVREIPGFPIGMGYEESLQHFFPVFINRPDLQMVRMEKPAFLLYFGQINEMQVLLPLLEKLQDAYRGEYLKTHNVVVVATGFSTKVLASLAVNWSDPNSINVLPFLVPNKNPIHNAAKNFIDDLAAVVGAEVYDPVVAPLDSAEGFNGIGNIAKDPEDNVWKPLGVTAFEVDRFRSSVIGHCQEDFLVHRIEEVKAQAGKAGEASQLDEALTRERLAKLTGGIAELTVVGSSNGETKERRDRADDAVCAVRGALQDGCLPAGCWTLIRLAEKLPDTVINRKIVKPALRVPLAVLMTNSGVVSKSRRDTIRATLNESALMRPEDATIWNAAEDKFVKADEAGLLDSVPAVREALRNAISIATVMGTVNALVVFPRDLEFETKEGHAVSEFNRMRDFNPADERP